MGSNFEMALGDRKMMHGSIAHEHGSNGLDSPQ
jgi:hypothetical protein